LPKTRTFFFLSQTTTSAYCFTKHLRKRKQRAAASRVFHGTRCTDISARMRAHYDVARHVTQNRCIYRRSLMFVCPFPFFFRADTCFLRCAASRGRSERRRDSVTKPSLLLSAFYFENVHALYFSTVSRNTRKTRGNY